MVECLLSTGTLRPARKTQLHVLAFEKSPFFNLDENLEKVIAYYSRIEMVTKTSPEKELRGLENFFRKFNFRNGKYQV